MIKHLKCLKCMPRL